MDALIQSVRQVFESKMDCLAITCKILDFLRGEEPIVSKIRIDHKLLACLDPHLKQIKADLKPELASNKPLPVLPSTL